MNKYENYALDLGFTKAVFLDDFQLEAEEKFRIYCNSDQCDRYGNSWVCPPGSGTIEDYQDLFSQYKSVLLLQTVKKMKGLGSKSFEQEEGKQAAWNLDEIYGLEREHNERLLKLLSFLRAKERLAQKDRAEDLDKREFLALTTGGCLLCEECTFPQEPCIKPEIRMHSLSASGIDVEKLCKKAGLDFSFGGSSVYYTACLLFK